MDSDALAQYIEAIDGTHKPWLLVQLRLQKLKDRRARLSETDYLRELAELQAELNQLGEWWVGRETDVFERGR